MIYAHFAPALVVKSLNPSISLPIAMTACIFPDILHLIFAALGVEKFNRDKNYSHTLLVVVLSAVLLFLASWLLGASLTNATIYSMCLLSHYPLDLINRHRMALTPWGGSLKGLGLNHEEGLMAPRLSLILELVLILFSVTIYGYSVYNGNLDSLAIPAMLAIGMLISETIYYRVYPFHTPRVRNKRENFY